MSVNSAISADGIDDSDHPPVAHYGTRLIRYVVSNRAISPMSVCSSTVTTGLDMTSLATRSARPKLERKSELRNSPSASNASHHSRRSLLSVSGDADEVALANHADRSAGIIEDGNRSLL